MINWRAWSQKPPRSYQPGRLLNHVAREFKQFQCFPRALPQAQFVAPDSSLTFEASEWIEKNFLGHTVLIEFEYRVEGSAPGQAEIQLAHTGHLRRSGISGRVKSGGAAAQAVINQLVTDEAFAQAILPLDFQQFYLIQDERGWRAATRQVGAAWIAMAFPPVRRYVPLGQDQVAALVATFKRLQQMLG
ncbi:MAG: hypothetical protein DPW09_24205 [Anaerolineae bacterium]|nr:DUF3156 family protein [Anaerolineales bacterium]MCQ3976547.1 hypothetical protein [Anaerolineae bacterium]